jgi:hypothetical protein
MRRVYLSELQNVRPQLDKYFDFGHCVKIMKMTSSMQHLSDRALGCKMRFSPERWAIFSEEPNSCSQFIDGDPSGGVRFLVDALLLYLGYTIRLGPLIHLQHKSAKKYEISACLYSGIHLDKPWPHEQTKLNIKDAEKIKHIFEKLITNYKIDLIAIPLSFYKRACEVKAIPYEALLIATIAMEALFLKNDREKAQALATRCGTLLGSKIGADPNDIYREMFSVYKIRNAIIHDGLSHPKIRVTDKSSTTWTLDCVTAQDITLNYLCQSLVAVLDVAPKNKQDFLQHIKSISTVPSKMDYKVQIM